MKRDPLNHYRGALVGLAVADAVGTTLEFQKPGSFDPISDMIGGGPFQLKPGQWTDDTSMALCLAESLVKKQDMDLVDQLQRYVRWYREGYMSSTGHCFDIGNTVREALHKFEKTGNPYSGSTEVMSAGNGATMRLAPVPLTTHGAPVAVDGCRYLGALIVGAVTGASKTELLSARYTPVPGYWAHHPLVVEIDEVAMGSFKQRHPPEIQGSGYVVKSLEAALWAFYHSETFKEGCLMAANLGDDADTTAAVYGQLAGAFYGETAIPETWRNQLAMYDTISWLAEQLYNQAN